MDETEYDERWVPSAYRIMEDAASPVANRTASEAVLAAYEGIGDDVDVCACAEDLREAVLAYFEGALAAASPEGSTEP